MARGHFLFVLAGLIASALAQQPEATPKRDPFAGFGNTSLDHKPAHGSTQSPFSQPATPASAATVPAPESGATGISLERDWTGHTTQSAGGQTMKMADLRALISPYGTAEADLAEHPDVTVYEGPVLSGGSGLNPATAEKCLITYLMPLNRAEDLLLKARGLSTVSRAVAPGLPDGLFLHTYDVHAGIYNHVCIVTDCHKPMEQVVCILLKGEGVNWYPPSPPFVKIRRNWHTFDYVNAENRGLSGIMIDTRVADLRGTGHYIVVNTTGGDAPDSIPQPGVVLKPSRYSPREDASWYVPEPLIKLMLYCLGHTLGSESGSALTPH